MPVVSYDLRDSPPLEENAAPPRHSRRSFLLGSAAAATGLALYSGEVSRHEIDITRRTFLVRRLPQAFDGFRIAQISDIHLKEFTEEFFLRRVVDHVNALTPDLVLITGDFITYGGLPESVSRAAVDRCGVLLKSLTCPQRFGILGNHDRSLGSRFVRDRLEKYDLPLLINQHLRIERGGQHLWLAGIDDSLGGFPSLNLAIPVKPDAPVILMAHEPDYANEIFTHPRGKQVDIILSGHTHGGQVRLPGLPAFSAALPVGGKAYPEGHFTLGNFQLYVNRGLGTVGVPFRFNCPPEITIHTLRPDVG